MYSVFYDPTHDNLIDDLKLFFKYSFINLIVPQYWENLFFLLGKVLCHEHLIWKYTAAVCVCKNSVQTGQYCLKSLREWITRWNSMEMKKCPV